MYYYSPSPEGKLRLRGASYCVLSHITTAQNWPCHSLTKEQASLGGGSRPPISVDLSSRCLQACFSCMELPGLVSHVSQITVPTTHLAWVPPSLINSSFIITRSAVTLTSLLASLLSPRK